MNTPYDKMFAALIAVNLAWNNRNETTSLAVWNERMKEAMRQVQDALNSTTTDA
jgi:hypothetical protein